MQTLWQDLRYGARMLLKQPGLTLVAVFTLALGIGANSAIFSVVNGVLLRPMPLEDPDRLIKIWETFLPGGQGTASAPNLKDWREQNTVFKGIAAYQFSSFNLRGLESPERLQGATVSPNFFDVVGAQPRLGRAFQIGEDEAGRSRVALLSHRLWQRAFGGDAGVVGKEIPLNGENYTVTGVMPPEFRFPSRQTEIWVPLAIPPDLVNDRDNHWMFTLARLKPDASFEQAREQMVTIAERPSGAQRLPHSFAGGDGSERTARAASADVRGRLRLADRLRQRSQPATGPRDLAPQRDCSADGARRGQAAPCQTTADRKSAVGRGGRRPGSGAGEVGRGGAAGFSGELPAARKRGRPGLARGNLHGGAQTNGLRSALVVMEVAATLVLLIGAGLLIKSFIWPVTFLPGGRRK